MHSYIDTAKSLPETLKFYRRDVITMANRINLNGTSFHGAGAIAEIANEAQARGFQKAFVCSDPDLIKFNVTAKVTDIGWKKPDLHMRSILISSQTRPSRMYRHGVAGI